jgi:hypothetical protein
MPNGDNISQEKKTPEGKRGGRQVGYLQSEEAATWVVGGSLVGSSIGVRAQYH